MFRWASPSMLCSTVPTSPPRGELCPEFSSSTEGIFLQMSQQQKHDHDLEWKVEAKKHENLWLTLKNESCKILKILLLFFYNSFNLPSPSWRVLSEKITSLLLLFDTWWGRRGGGWQVMNILVNVMHWRASVHHNTYDYWLLRQIACNTNIVVDASECSTSNLHRFCVGVAGWPSHPALYTLINGWTPPNL